MSKKFDFENMDLDDMRAWIGDLHRRAEQQRVALILLTVLVLALAVSQAVTFARGGPDNLQAILTAALIVFVLAGSLIALFAAWNSQ